MGKIHPQSVVKSFASELADAIGSQNSLAISISDFGALKLDNAQKQVSGLQWFDSVPAETQYDFIVADLPIGMGRDKIKIGHGEELNVRRNWSELTKAVRLLKDNGLCLALTEPPAFGIAEGPKYQEALSLEGYHLNGIFNAPEGLLATTSIRPVFVVISRSQSEDIFAAELEDEAQAIKLAQAFISRSPGNSLSEGLLIRQGTFTGFASLKAAQQLSKLETQYKEYDSVRLGDIADEINVVRSGQCHEAKANSVYIPMLGALVVTHDVTQVSIKHHNLFQVVLSEKANNEYLSAFFQSDLGKLVLNSLVFGAVIPKIRKSDLAEARIALPSIEEQKEIAFTYRRLSSLSYAIANFQSELALNPRSAAAIKLQLENMLEQIGGLTDADKVMNLTRSGESKTVEFKESFSLDVRKGTKEKIIELFALKTLVAFLNTNGGTLLIGVSDKGEIPGIGEEIRKFHNSNDAFLLHFKNQIKHRIGEQYYPFINQRIVNVHGSYVLMVECGESPGPCYLDGNDFYVRTNPATDKLEGPKLVDYVRNHFKI
jgi:hypothetical protein